MTTKTTEVTKPTTITPPEPSTAEDLEFDRQGVAQFLAGEADQIRLAYQQLATERAIYGDQFEKADRAAEALKEIGAYYAEIRELDPEIDLPDAEPKPATLHRHAQTHLQTLANTWQIWSRRYKVWASVGKETGEVLAKMEDLQGKIDRTTEFIGSHQAEKVKTNGDIS